MITWARRGRTYLAIDESIAIKGNKSAHTKAVHQLTAWDNAVDLPMHVHFIRILTGRPQTQGPQDLWGQLRAIGRFRSKNFYSFRGEYCVMGGWMAKQVVAAKNPERLAAEHGPGRFPAGEEEGLAKPLLPNKRMTIRDYEMSGEQKSQYKSMEEEFSTGDREWRCYRRDVAIAKYAKLAQIQTGFIYDETGVARELFLWILPRTPRLNPFAPTFWKTRFRVRPLSFTGTEPC